MESPEDAVVSASQRQGFVYWVVGEGGIWGRIWDDALQEKQSMHLWVSDHNYSPTHLWVIWTVEILSIRTALATHLRWKARQMQLSVHHRAKKNMLNPE